MLSFIQHHVNPLLSFLWSRINQEKKISMLILILPKQEIFFTLGVPVYQVPRMILFHRDTVKYCFLQNGQINNVQRVLSITHIHTNIITELVRQDQQLTEIEVIFIHHEECFNFLYVFYLPETKKKLEIFI